MCVMCVAIPFVLVTIAPRFIPAAEVNLFFLLETIIGPIWVWLIIKEQPSFETILGAIFLKEMPSKGTWIAIFITFLAALFIFYDSLQVGNLFGNIMGFVTAAGLAVNAVLIRYAKDRDLLPSAVMGKLGVAVFAFFFVENFI